MPSAQTDKLLPSLDAAFEACEIRDGAVLSFHHHLRDGDAVAALVLQAAADRGLRDLGVAISSIFPVHAPLVEHIRSGVVTRLWTSYAKGPVADALSHGMLREKVVFQSHGGRARAIEAGDLPIDAAFIAAPVASGNGALTGAIGRAACGPLGYPMVDAAHARRVIAVTEEISPDALPRTEIDGRQVHNIVRVDSIGDPSGIVSGATRPATDAESLSIARQAVRVITASGLMQDGFSFQTGSGGISLATVAAIGTAMRERGVTGSFISGGICGAHVDLVREGLFREVVDVQCFDPEAVASYASDPWHRAMSAAEYASPLHPDPVVDKLDAMVLGAAEIDANFNINVLTGGDGRIMGGPGGHPDTAEGAKLTIATTRLTGGGYPKIVERVGTITTPGRNVDVLVTDAGIAVNPKREDLAQTLSAEGLPVVDVGKLMSMAGQQATRKPVRGKGPIIGHLEDRHGTEVDTITGVSAPS